MRECCPASTLSLYVFYNLAMLSVDHSDFSHVVRSICHCEPEKAYHPSSLSRRYSSYSTFFELYGDLFSAEMKPFSSSLACFIIDIKVPFASRLVIGQSPGAGEGYFDIDYKTSQAGEKGFHFCAEEISRNRG